MCVCVLRVLGVLGWLRRYDLTFQFDTIPLKHDRDGSQKDLLLYLPDSILVVDQVLGKYLLHDLHQWFVFLYSYAWRCSCGVLMVVRCSGVYELAF